MYFVEFARLKYIAILFIIVYIARY